MKSVVAIEGGRSGASLLDDVPPATALYDRYTLGIPLTCLIVIRTVNIERDGPRLIGCPSDRSPICIS